MQREYRGLSRRTQQLLQMAEGRTVDFKRDASGVKSRDLVAFANAPLGGTILIGVEEYTSNDGVQRGRVVGCRVDDSVRLILVNKATDCFPTVDLELYVENLADRPILRLEIPSGQYKPYCTQRGDYAIRSDGRNRALLPDELLAIFMEREGELFLARFHDAVTRLERQLVNLRHLLSSGMLDVSEHIGELDSQLSRTTARLGQLTDSNKKRSRNLLQILEQSRDTVSLLESHLRPEVEVEQADDHDLLLDIQQKLDLLINEINPEIDA
ncbi:AlbA family DNA-binding domain-containing protein [Marinobacterium arenosum]|uniref:AlbA family DNA-binding domain-containing protein n=1 Tax=Marinobacterium arenosum TaxID=2862496 RepID=UPI001C944349|nr:ATP-binding protein [Marinobacterium arenosum]MBY4677988.1 ATP-binding protein [Marinobacterium arenosum]